ncbi:TIGR03885 family FMN-dependent LLM class oxidoreductase [Cesiribacter andamanensis]|uniref:Glucose-6-phosphate dehydrogenase n=1 Tax=Cesiribacter andamanensis AMV16 TaxID=1279009 RepID=M7N0P2_9BACT|nr:TIGR03885 family FMN-dependent LLM class oxidoreductase [Cesiribacter andamanensis]EMR00877.1 glucose-6-phosphate dehydrogenase [Cesiribacter andamanensis AMV16]
MPLIGYHASHEQFSPSHLLQLVQQAEAAGFGGCLSSDHFHPWTDEQGESAFAWSWLGAAMQATGFEYGIVNAPGQRYHPAIIAQAAATLAEMFPDRFWIATGSGQNLNEHITGAKWPDKVQRNQRLQESVQIMRRLWQGETVTHRSELLTVEEAKLYTRPKRAPKVIGAAITAKTAAWMAASDWADGVITTSKPLEELRPFVEEFRSAGGSGKQLYLKVQLSYHPDKKRAFETAWQQWRSNIYPSQVTADLAMPAQFAGAGKLTDPEKIREHVLIGDSADYFIEQLSAYAELGIDKLFLHNVNLEQEQYIEFFGKSVLPELV